MRIILRVSETRRSRDLLIISRYVTIPFNPLSSSVGALKIVCGMMLLSVLGLIYELSSLGYIDIPSPEMTAYVP